MFKRLWRKFIRSLFVGGVAAALLGGGSAYADDKDDLRGLKEQLEQQKKQIEELQKQLGTIALPAARTGGDGAAGGAELPPVPAADKGSVEKIVGDYLKRRDDEKKKKDDEDKAKKEAEGYKVGTDLGMSVRWNINNGVTFSTTNKDFVSHIGVRFQQDWVWWNQSRATVPLNQVGDLQDGVFFRRLRPSWDGTAWEVVEWNVELALEQINNNVINFDECWAGVMNLPVIGSARVGHIRVPQGFEGDMYSSSKGMTFLERSMYTDAFYENFGPGVWLTNNFLDQRVTYAAAFYRQDNDNRINQTNNAVDFNDGEGAITGRLTALPIWEHDGRCWMHVGASYTFREAEFPNGSSTSTPPKQGGTGAAGPRQLEFAARPQLRDAIGDYGNTVLSGNSKRIVDTGPIAADDSQVIGLEWAYVNGPIYLQAEYAWATADNAVTLGGTNVSSTKVKTGTRVGSPWFSGGYIQASYMLTGESRTYDRRLGRLGSNYIASPYTPFWLTRAEDGGYTFGRGAWEIAARYNYLDLNDNLIQGGRSNALEGALNWYLNNNLKIQFVYLWQNRFDLKPGQVNGDFNGFGIRTQFFF